ncbi:MAG: kelch repeat-containing protein, partial [bacterium]
MQTKAIHSIRLCNLYTLLLLGFFGIVWFGSVQFASAANDPSQIFSISRLEPDSIKVLPAPATLNSDKQSSPIPVSKLNPIPLSASGGLPAPSPFNSVQGKKSGIKSFSGWTTLLSEGFEGVFPYTGWSVSGNPTWDDDDYKPHTGSWSAWCANGGTQGLDPAVSNYTSNMNAWMSYGPFSLTDCTGAELSFYLWNESETNKDYFWYGVSTDGSNYYANVESGSTGGWVSHHIDLSAAPSIGDLRGQPEVWINFVFTSNSTVNYKGAFIDDILIRKYLDNLPNIVPSQPVGCSDIIMINHTPDESEGIVYSGLTSYITWGTANDSDYATNTEVYFELYDNGNSIGIWWTSGYPMAGHGTAEVDDTPYVFTTYGLHTIQLVVDLGNRNLESNEADNTYTRTKYVSVVKPDINVQPVSFNKTITQGTITYDILTIRNVAPVDTTLYWLLSESVSSSGNLAGLQNFKTSELQNFRNQTVDPNTDWNISNPIPTNLNTSAKERDSASLLGSSSWSILSSMSIGRSRTTAAMVNGKIYVIGGESSGGVKSNSVEMYDPETNTWTTKANKPTGVSNVCCAAIGNKIYVPGGYTGSYSSVLEIYDTQYDTWTTGASLPYGISGAAAVAYSGALYVFGGVSTGSVYLTTCHVYDSYGDSWSQVSSMNYARNLAGAAVVNGKIYVIGGYNGSDKAYCEEYDPWYDTWTVKSPMNLARGGVGVGAVDGYIYAVGGGFSSYYPSCERYNPVTDTWTMSTEIIPNLNYGRRTFGIAVDNKTIYALAGYNGSYMNSVESFTIESLDWLDESVKYGSTNSGATTLLQLTFDATSLPLGDTTGYLIVTSNDSERTPIVIPITLHVVAPPEINVLPTYISKTVGWGSTSYSIMTIANSGGSPLNYYIYETSATTSWSFSKVPSIKNQGLDTKPTPTSSSVQPTGYVPIPAQSNSLNLIPATVLLLQDTHPWDTYSLESVLDANGIFYTIASSADIPTINLTPYKIVMIASDQSSTFYATYLANTAKFDSYVANGGILEFHACSFGWNDGNFLGPLVGGVTINWVYENYNSITDAAHPAVHGVPDLIYGSSASHGDFDNLISGTDIITRELNRNQPTLIEYKYGTGRVLASTQPLEYGYAYDQESGPILNNLILHAYRLSRGDINWLNETPQSGSTPNGTYSLITVTLDATNVTAGITTTAYLQILSNDPDETWTSIPVTIYVAPPDIAVQPTYIVKTVAHGGTTYSSLTISNTGIGILDYYIHESIDSASWGFTKISASKGLYPTSIANSVSINNRISSIEYDPNAVSAVGLYKNINDRTANSSSFYWILGTAISSFQTGLIGAWGVGQDIGHLWVGNQGFDAGGDNLDYQFTFSGITTGKKMDTTPWIAGYWGADMAFDGTYLWQVHVGDDNKIYQLNPNTGLVVSSTQSIPWATSQRGVAFDPDTKTLWVGGWNEGILYNITTTGSVITTYSSGLAISGLAWHRESRTLWVITNSSPDMIYRINPNTFSYLSSFAAPLGYGGTTSYNAGAGLEMIGDHLWAVNQINNTLVEIDCGITNNIDWLEETPQSGSVPANNKSSVQLAINATSLPVGRTTTAYLHIYSNDPDENPVMVRVRVTCISDTTKPVSAAGSISPYWRKSTPI